jgi:hypothetical protein
MKFRLLQIFLLAVSFQSLAESAFDYDYLYGGLGYNSPLSKDEINARLSSFGIRFEPGGTNRTPTLVLYPEFGPKLRWVSN